MATSPERQAFAHKMSVLTNTHAERAVGLLWYYRHRQEFDERTASELALDLHALGFPRPRPSRLATDLIRTRHVTRGERKDTFRIDLRRLAELDEKFGSLLEGPHRPDSGSILPPEWVRGTRPYLECITIQINGTFDEAYYDGTAVLMRRLMESLLIDCFVSRGLVAEIRASNQFVGLESLINKAAAASSNFQLGRNSKSIMDKVKVLGDTAAHDRSYITLRQDIDDIKAAYRKLIHELLGVAGASTGGGAA
jgi:hypothetical protein